MAIIFEVFHAAGGGQNQAKLIFMRFITAYGGLNFEN
jgi:hypothetical protein